MKKILPLLLLLALAAFAQQTSVAVLPSDGAAFDNEQIKLITDKMREAAVSVLPIEDFAVLPQDVVMKRLGGIEGYIDKCRESACAVDMGKQVQSDYVSQASVGKLGDIIRLKVELYNVKTEGLVGMLNYEAENLRDLLGFMDSKVPDLFRKIRSYLAHINSEPAGASLKFGFVADPRCAQTPCDKKFSEESARITASLDQYEDADTTVAITHNDQSINIKLKPKFGILEVKPAYIDSIGKDKQWSLELNDKPYPFGEIKLDPKEYALWMGHECYENIRYGIDIKKGDREVFDLANRIVLKKGSLMLKAKLNGRAADEQPVFVNGKRVGQTPFAGSVPVCAEIKLGENKETVYANIIYNEKVEYTHKMKPSKIIFGTAIALDVLGAGFIAAGVWKNGKAKDEYDKYSKRGQTPEYYEDARKKVDSQNSQRNMFYAIGGALLAAGIGVHIWF